jgi:hypothetical protein
VTGVLTPDDSIFEIAPVELEGVIYQQRYGGTVARPVCPGPWESPALKRSHAMGRGYLLPQSLASSSVASRPALVARCRKSARRSSSVSSYPAQIWSIEAFIPA